MATTTLTQVTQAVDYWYNPMLLSRAVSNFVHTRWAQVRDLPRNAGDDIKFRRYGNLSAATTALTEGVTPTGSQLSITDVTATALQYGDYITMSDKLIFTTLDPILMETAELLGDQAGDTIDQLTRDILAAGTTIQYASTATATNEVTAAMVLNTAEVREAVLTLQENKAKYIKEIIIQGSDKYATQPVGKCYVGIIHPKTLRDLKDDTNFIPVHKYASQTGVMEDEVGSIDEVRFVMTPNAKVAADGASSANVYRTIIMGKDYYGITRISGEAMKTIIKPLGSGGSTDPLDQRQTVGWKATFVAKILNESFGVIVQHGATQ